MLSPQPAGHGWTGARHIGCVEPTMSTSSTWRGTFLPAPASLATILPLRSLDHASSMSPVSHVVSILHVSAGSCDTQTLSCMSREHQCLANLILSYKLDPILFQGPFNHILIVSQFSTPRCLSQWETVQVMWPSVSHNLCQLPQSSLRLSALFAVLFLPQWHGGAGGRVCAHIPVP